MEKWNKNMNEIKLNSISLSLGEHSHLLCYRNVNDEQNIHF